MCFGRLTVQGHGLLSQGLAFLEMTGSAGPILSNATSVALGHRSMNQKLGGLLRQNDTGARQAHTAEQNKECALHLLLPSEVKLISGLCEVQEPLYQFKMACIS